MPQLDPGPWLSIWLTSWLIFIFMMPSLIMLFQPYNSQTKGHNLKNTKNPWYWPWP
uniref:ATP synthase complex subunit 8 n=1 Tax=Paraplagusia bilineata TaxID=1148453 RepID=V9INV2_9PLEU|nr:ATP synthase F0 subunit 8 [Paraplagusia bilineata]AFB71251.1 ATP synthase subunit 8 [Paraplagusia bilineata]